MRRFAYRGNYRSSKKQITGIVEADDRASALALLAKRDVEITHIEAVVEKLKADPNRPTAEILPPVKVEKPVAARAPRPARLASPPPPPPPPSPADDPANLDFGLTFKSSYLSATGSAAKTERPRRPGAVTATAALSPPASLDLLLPPQYHTRVLGGLLAAGGIYFAVLAVSSLLAKPPVNPKAPLPPAPPPVHLVISGSLQLPSGVRKEEVRAHVEVNDVNFIGNPSGNRLWGKGPGELAMDFHLRRTNDKPMHANSFTITFTAPQTLPLKIEDQPLTESSGRLVGHLPPLRMIGQ